MTRRRTPDDLLHPERIFFRMINDYQEGRLHHEGKLLHRAVVIDVDTVGGQLESQPPNPVGSIRARVYTRGLDATTPRNALTIFYPFFPEHIAPPVAPDEHVYVIFEDEGYSNGLWVTTVPNHRDINFRDPEENRETASTSANQFEGTQPTRVPINRDAEFGGLAEENAIREEVVQVFSQDTSGIFEGKKVLHVGDSQVAGPYGRILGDLILEKGAASYVRDGRPNWGVRAWINGRLGSSSRQRPTIKQLAERHQPDIIIMTLGGNDHQIALNDEEYPFNAAVLFQEAKDNADIAIWIGPPTAVGRSSRLQAGRDRVCEIARITASPFYIDSRDVTGLSGRSRDGVHFTPRGARAWAEAISVRLERF